VAREKGQFGWYVTFVVIAVVASVGVWSLTGQDALAAAVRFLWNGLALFVNMLARLLGSLVGLLARGVGWRRLSRIANVIGGIGLGYAASVVISEEKVRRARNWRSRLRTMITIARNKWQALPLAWKLFAVGVLVASQVYLHSVLILFPIAFLVPVVRRIWVRVADLAFGSWYWKKFGTRHRSLVSRMQTLPGLRSIIGWGRLTRMRYLTAWRLWRYHPRYRIADSARRQVNFVEPVKLWWRCELDTYIANPLMAGCRDSKPSVADKPVPKIENGWATSRPSMTLSSANSMAQRDA
jgi:hypothetical protein